LIKPRRKTLLGPNSKKVPVAIAIPERTGSAGRMGRNCGPTAEAGRRERIKSPVYPAITMGGEKLVGPWEVDSKRNAREGPYAMSTL